MGCRDQGWDGGVVIQISLYLILMPQGSLDLEKLGRIWRGNKNEEGFIEKIWEVGLKI